MTETRLSDELKRLDEFVVELREKGGLNRPWGYSGHGCYDTVFRDFTVLVDLDDDGIRVGVYGPDYPDPDAHAPLDILYEGPTVAEVKDMLERVTNADGFPTGSQQAERMSPEQEDMYSEMDYDNNKEASHD